MRFLPLVLVAFMAAPALVWIVVSNLMVKGTSGSMFGFETTGTVTVLIGFAVVSLALLGGWMMRFIARDQNRGV